MFSRSGIVERRIELHGQRTFKYGSAEKTPAFKVIARRNNKKQEKIFESRKIMNLIAEPLHEAKFQRNYHVEEEEKR